MTWSTDITAAPRGEEKKTVAQILKEARALIADEKNWTQGTYSRDKDGEFVEPTDRRAVCFCALGALARASRSRDPDDNLPGEAIIVALVGERGYPNVAQFNDSHTHGDVVALFDEGVARAEAEAVQ